MLPYVQGPGDPSNFEEYDPEDPVTADEVYDEEYLMVRLAYAFWVTLTSLKDRGLSWKLLGTIKCCETSLKWIFRWNSVISNIHATLSRKFNKFKIKSCSMYSSMWHHVTFVTLFQVTFLWHEMNCMIIPLYCGVMDSGFIASQRQNDPLVIPNRVCVIGMSHKLWRHYDYYDTYWLPTQNLFFHKQPHSLHSSFM